MEAFGGRALDGKAPFFPPTRRRRYQTERTSKEERREDRDNANSELPRLSLRRSNGFFFCHRDTAAASTVSFHIPSRSPFLSSPSFSPVAFHEKMSGAAFPPGEEENGKKEAFPHPKSRKMGACVLEKGASIPFRPESIRRRPLFFRLTKMRF